MAPLAKLEALSEISRDIGQVFFASVLVEPFVHGTFNETVAITGSVLALIFWFTYILLSKS